MPRLTDGHAKGLAQLLRVNGRLGCLSLASNDVTADGAEALGKALRGKYNDQLASLDLSANLLGAGGAAALGEALESNTALKELKLTQCGGGLECPLPGLTSAPSPPRLPPPGALAAPTHRRAPPQHRGSARRPPPRASGRPRVADAALFDLPRCGLGDADCEALAKGLKANTALTSLHLGGNSLRPDGCAALAYALARNGTLQSLQLAKNWVGNEGAAHMAEAIKVNAGLRFLDLSENHIHEPGAEALAEALGEIKVGVIRSKLQKLKLDALNVDTVQEATEGRAGVELIAVMSDIRRLSTG